MDFSMFIRPEMVGFLFGTIFFIEILKKSINAIRKKELPVFIWKLVVFVVGFGSAAIDLWSDINARSLIILGLTYAAGATLIYQTGKMVLLFDRHKEKETEE